MFKELCNKAIAEGKNPIHYIFESFKKDCCYFIETGSHYGNSINTSLELGFEKVFSCDINNERIKHCLERFKNKNVSLFNLNSIDFLKHISKDIDKKALFWLDAHAEGGGVPTLEELKIIKHYYIKNHCILIDDIPSYFPTLKSINELKDAILDINPNYKFINIQTNHNTELDVLGAYIE